MKLISRVLPLFLFFAVFSPAQERAHARLEVILNYQDAQACQTILSLHLPDVISCSQAITVMASINNPDVQSFIVVIAYTDQEGERQLQVARVAKQSNANLEIPGTSSAAAGFTGVDNVTELSTTVIAGDGTAATVTRANQ